MKHVRDPITGRCALCDNLGNNGLMHDSTFYPEGEVIPKAHQPKPPNVIQISEKLSPKPPIAAEVPTFAPTRPVLPPIDTSYPSQNPNAYYIYGDQPPPPLYPESHEYNPERKREPKKFKSKPIKKKRGWRQCCTKKICCLAILATLLALFLLGFLAFLGYGIYRLHEGLIAKKETHVYQRNYGADQPCEDSSGKIWALEAFNEDRISKGRRRKRSHIVGHKSSTSPAPLTTTLLPCDTLTTKVYGWSSWTGGGAQHISAADVTSVSWTLNMIIMGLVTFAVALFKFDIRYI